MQRVSQSQKQLNSRNNNINFHGIPDFRVPCSCILESRLSWHSYGLDARGSIRGNEDFSFIYYILTVSESHPTSYPMGNVSSFHKG
jgi:hypothetical protein